MVYGSTEAEPIAAVDHQQVSVTVRRRMRGGGGLLAGRPVHGCDVAVVSSRPGVEVPPLSASEFDGLKCPVQEIGEIVVAGRHVLSGYADSTRNASTKIPVDDRIWHRTGDAGYFDENGMLWLVGRQDAAIHDALGTVYPFQVEYALSELPGIRRAALTRRNGVRTLVLELRGGSILMGSGEAAACIASHHIERIVTVRRIPLDKRHNSKIDYPALSRMLDGRASGVRLGIVDALSRSFRELRHVCRRFTRYCQSMTTATKVGECRIKTK